MNNTLKDIAARAGVSAVSVHKAIYDKPGISEDTRARILKIVEEVGYSVNAAASSLKRDVLRIAVISPLLEYRLNYFFSIVNEGIDEIALELRNFRIDVERIPCDRSWQNQAELLDGIIERDDIDGVALCCWDDTKLNDRIARLKDKGVPVVTFNSDASDSCRISAVTAPNDRIGKLAAEFLCQIVPPRGRLVILGGNRMMRNLREITLGFFSYVQKNRPELCVTEINDFGSMEDLTAELECTFAAFGDITGLYSASARNNLPMCETIKKAGLSGKVKVVTNDVYRDLEPYFDEGVISATIWQDPKTQSSLAVRVLAEHLTGQKKIEENYKVRIGLVMKNNLQDYL